jgi:hypothetical protein
MTEDEHLAAFGLRPRPEDLPAIRSVLEAETAREHDDDDEGNTELMLLCCVQLFNSGRPDDILRIWRAKEASFDAACYIDVQLLCGSGLHQTKTYLSEQATPEAHAALSYLTECEETGDFATFSVEEDTRRWSRYFSDDAS